MSDLLAAIGLAVVIEGAVYAVFPEAMKKYLGQVLNQPATSLRRMGIIAAIFGVFIVWLVKSDAF
mgnify:CR=1 FL=1